MRERLITLVCALGAIVLFMAMFMQREVTFDPRNDIPRPTSAERRGNGYHAAMTWLEAEGIRAASLRQRFDELPQLEDLPPTGNLLIVTLPATGDFRTEEFLPLDAWVRAGNTLLVLAALSDNPDWAFALGGLASGDLNLLTGLEFETAKARVERLKKRNPLTLPSPPRAGERVPEAGEGDIAAAFRAFAEPQEAELEANRPHAYFEGVSEVVALSDYPQQAWAVKVPYEGFVLELAHEREYGEGALWTRPLGEGRIIVSGYGSIFTNRTLGERGNAQLFANIVGANVAKNGVVLFDDVHQGLGATYDPNKFYSDRRLYVTIGVLCLLWFIWVLGSTRLRAVVIRTPAPREAELVRTTGGMLSRVLPGHAAARRLIDNFFRRVTEHAPKLREAGAPWDYLERHPRVSPADLGQLKGWYADALAARRVPLDRLHNLLARIDRQVT
jgi:hypothetical protein